MLLSFTFLDDPSVPMSELSLQQLGAAIKRIIFADEAINYTVSLLLQ